MKAPHFIGTDSTVTFNGVGNTDWDCRDAENRDVGNKSAGSTGVGSRDVESRGVENRDEESIAGGENTDVDNIAVLDSIAVAGSIPDCHHHNLRTLRLPTFPSLEPLPI